VTGWISEDVLGGGQVGGLPSTVRWADSASGGAESSCMAMGIGSSFPQRLRPGKKCSRFGEVERVEISLSRSSTPDC